MSIQYALLTSLLEKPCSGYDLASRFDRSIGYFWQASHQQIYRELSRMEKSGWLSVAEEGVPGSRRRKVYTVLPAGRNMLAEWAGSMPDGSESLESSRRTILIRLRAEAVIGPLGVGNVLAALIAEREQHLVLYREIEKRDFSAANMSRKRRIQYTILEYGILAEEGWLSWAKDTLALLQEPAKTSR